MYVGVITKVKEIVRRTRSRIYFSVACMSKTYCVARINLTTDLLHLLRRNYSDQRYFGGKEENYTLQHKALLSRRAKTSRKIEKPKDTQNYTFAANLRGATFGCPKDKHQPTPQRDSDISPSPAQSCCRFPSTSWPPAHIREPGSCSVHTKAHRTPRARTRCPSPPC